LAFEDFILVPSPAARISPFTGLLLFMSARYDEEYLEVLYVI